MTITIRRATLTDLDIAAALFDGYRQFYQQPADFQRARHFLAERLDHGESVVFLAENKGAPAGFMQLYPGFSSLRTGRTWTLNDLFVASEARRLGVGKALLEVARHFAIADGALGLQLETRRTNTAAQKLYESAGWQKEQETFSYYLTVNSLP